MTRTGGIGGQPGPLVLLDTVSDAFHARVIAARLGADGVLTELRGGTGGIYPFGHVSVWVRSEDEPVARELLLADQVEDAFRADDSPDEGLGGTAARPAWIAPWQHRRLLAAAALVAMVVTAVGGRLAS